MTKEYKQIEVTVGELTTMNFKKAIAYAKEHNIDKLVFSWSAEARTSSEAFATRITNVLNTLTNWVFEAEPEGTNHLIITRKDVLDD